MEDCKLLDGLQNGTQRGKEGAADQSIHGRVGLGTACKGETLKMENVSIESSGGRKVCLWVEKNCIFKEKFLYTRKHSYIAVIICYGIITAFL
jgi:hypothetical protein